MFDKADKKLTDEETKKDEESKRTALPKLLRSSNDFKEAIKLIEDIRTDTNNVKSNGDKKVFNNLNELIKNIKNNKTTKKITIKKIRNIVSDLDQLREKQGTVFQNKMINVVYYLFNSLGISSKSGKLMLPKWVKLSEKKFNKILRTVTKAKNRGLKTNVDGREITLDNTERLLKDLGNGLVGGHEFKNRYNDIIDDIEAILDDDDDGPFTRNRKKKSTNYGSVKKNYKDQI